MAQFEYHHILLSVPYFNVTSCIPIYIKLNIFQKIFTIFINYLYISSKLTIPITQFLIFTA